MANVIKWEAAWNSEGNVLTTELNALSDAGLSAAGTEVDNSTNLDQYGKLELTVDFVSAPSAGAFCDIYMITAPDGTNYEDTNVGNKVTSIPVAASTAAQRLTSRMFPLQPSKCKFLLENRTGQPFPATGSILKLYSTNDEVQ